MGVGLSLGFTIPMFNIYYLVTARLPAHLALPPCPSSDSGARCRETRLYFKRLPVYSSPPSVSISIVRETRPLRPRRACPTIDLLLFCPPPPLLLFVSLFLLLLFSHFCSCSRANYMRYRLHHSRTSPEMGTVIHDTNEILFLCNSSKLLNDVMSAA